MLPSATEIKVLVVYKKLVKSGWIIGADELKQVFSFNKLRAAMLQNYEFRKFLEHFVSMLGLPSDDLSIYMEPEEDENEFMIQARAVDVIGKSTTLPRIEDRGDSESGHS